MSIGQWEDNNNNRNKDKASSAGLFMQPRLVRSRLKDVGVSERKQVGDVVALVEGGAGAARALQSGSGGTRGNGGGSGGSGFYNPNNEL